MIRVKGKTLPKVRDTSSTSKRVEGSEVAAALGAQPVDTPGPTAQGPVALFGLRQALAARLRSTGGRPGLGVGRRQKVPLDDADWELLCRLSELLADDKSRPTPAQIASVLLRRRLQQVAEAIGHLTSEQHRSEVSGSKRAARG